MKNELKSSDVHIFKVQNIIG